MLVIFLHGNVGSPNDWAPVVSGSTLGKANISIPSLWEYFREPRDHGLADWARWFVASLPDPQETVLVGYSLGGRLALHALLEAPTLFAGAVMISTNTGLATSDERVSRLDRDRQWATMASAGWSQFVEAWNAQSVFRGSGPLPNRDLLEPFQAEISGSFDRWSLGRQENLLPDLNTIQCPSMWLSGEHDERFAAIGAQAAAASSARHVIVQDAGHRVPMDQPGRVAKAIDDFVAAIT